jgi:F-type H+-transporting ATPase subunit a
MYWLAEGAHKAAAEHAEEATHHSPIIVQFVNNLFGEQVHEFQMHYTKPRWDWFLGKFGSSAEAAFGPYTAENAIPWYTVMFFIACLLSVIIIWILKGQLSSEKPGPGQQTLEVGVLSVRSMIEDIIGPHGLKYFPVVLSFGVLILVSNLMGLFPLFMSPTSATSVTFALGLSSFLYYNYIGISENGIIKHFKHFAGPIWWIAPLIFPIEIISNLIRPFSLGIRLFGNLFADEKVLETVAHLAPPVTWFAPILLLPLSVFVAFVQTFVFILLSQLYLSEVSHAPHEHHAHEEPREEDGDEFVVPVLT